MYAKLMSFYVIIKMRVGVKESLLQIHFKRFCFQKSIVYHRVTGQREYTSYII